MNNDEELEREGCGCEMSPTVGGLGGGAGAVHGDVDVAVESDGTVQQWCSVPAVKSGDAVRWRRGNGAFRHWLHIL